MSESECTRNGWFKSMNVEKNFNLLISAFRQMDGDPRQLAALLNTALKDTKWGTYQKYGITLAALILVAKNRANKPKNGYWFKGVESAHIHKKEKWTFLLVTEDIESPYLFMLEHDKCILATAEENDIEGSGHWSKIFDLDPSLFGNGARPNLLKRHERYENFIKLIDQVG